MRSLVSIATGGRWPGKRIAVEEDAAEPKQVRPPGEFTPAGTRTLSKVDAVFLSGNTTRDDIPSHLVTLDPAPPEVQALYEHMCPAGVYEAGPDGLVVNAPNCIDCKATDVLGPRWSPREGGSGPAYKRM
jgi:ferredoxin-like protein FixX